MKNVTSTEINKSLKLIKNRGITPVTSLQKVQQEYSLILTPVGKSENSGLVLSYTQAKNVIKDYFPNEEFTREQYQNMLNDLYNQYSDRLTVRGELKYQKDYATDFIMEYFGDELADKVSKLSSTRITQLFREAKSKSSNKGDANYESNNFLVNLETLIEENT